MLRLRQVPIIEALLALPLLAGAAPHDPTAHPPWRPLGPEGAVPTVRAIAIDGSTVFALCKKGLVSVSAGKVEVCLGIEQVANAQSLDVTGDRVWLGGSGTVQHMDRKTKTLERIAREQLDLETLEQRKSDHLDFHDLAVWQIRAALDAAYEAGRQARR